MATARLELDEATIGPVIKDVRSDATDTNYMVLKYESKNKIVVGKTGTGDIQALHEDLSDDEVQYVLFRFMSGDQESKRVKFMCALLHAQPLLLLLRLAHTAYRCTRCRRCSPFLHPRGRALLVCVQLPQLGCVYWSRDRRRDSDRHVAHA